MLSLIEAPLNEMNRAVLMEVSAVSKISRSTLKFLVRTLKS